MDETKLYNDPMELYEEVTFKHMYDTAGFDKDAPRTHSCLRHGHWCWKNALENPRMAIRYLKRKWTKLN